MLKSALGGPVARERSQKSESAALEVSARTATALGERLGDIRDALDRLAQAGLIANERHAAAAAALAKMNRCASDRLVAELLAYSGHQMLVPRAVELLPLLCSLADLLRRTLDECIAVTVEVDDDCLPCFVDARALKEALINLAINARDAMPDGGRMQLMASLNRQIKGVPAVALTVTDSGVGMAPHNAQRAAIPFFTTKTNDPLAGLGLAAVEGFVRQSGGSLELQTSIGRGTSVTLCLPCAEWGPLNRI